MTQILAACGLGPDLSRIDPDVLEAARERGSAVHEAIAAHHYGYDFTLNPEWQPWLDAYLKFVHETEHEPIVSECEVIHPQWKYCGHPDRIGWHQQKRRALFDWKAGGAQGVECQLAGYRLAWNATHPREPIETCFAVQFRGDGTYRLHEIDTAKPNGSGFAPEHVFLAAVTVVMARGGM